MESLRWRVAWLRIQATLRRLPVVLRWIALLLAVGTLVEFLPIDLAVVAVSVVALHASIYLGIVWGWLGRRVGMRPAPLLQHNPGIAADDAASD